MKVDEGVLNEFEEFIQRKQGEPRGSMNEEVNRALKNYIRLQSMEENELGHVADIIKLHASTRTPVNMEYLLSLDKQGLFEYIRLYKETDGRFLKDVGVI